MTPGTLVLTIKTTMKLSKLADLTHGAKVFAVNCDGRVVSFLLRPKYYLKIDDMVRKRVPFQVIITGKMGMDTHDGFDTSKAFYTQKGFEFEDATIQVFERKPKVTDVDAST